MEGIWDVTENGRRTGSCRISYEGLYAVLDCSCQLTDPGVRELYLSAGGQQCRLGIPVPEGGVFRLRTRLARRRLPQGEPVLWLQKRCRPDPRDWECLEEGKPFRRLGELEQAVLGMRQGKPGLWFRTPGPMEPDDG